MNMKTRNTDIQTVRRLLDKYYAGVSTPDEERVLREFFASADCSSLPDDLRDEAYMMTVIRDADDRLRGMADPVKITNAYLTAASRATDRDGSKSCLRHKLHFLWNPAAAVIITLIIATVCVLYTPQQECQTPNADTACHAASATDPYIEVDNQEEADRLLTETFSLIGKRMALAQNTMSKTRTKLDKTNLTVKNILKNEKI